MFHLLTKYLEIVGSVAGFLWAFYLKAFEIRHLRREKKDLEEENRKLHDEQSIEFAKGVEKLLAKVTPTVCQVCEHLVSLRYSTTFVNAISCLDALLTTVANWEEPPTLVDLSRVLERLDEASTLALWSRPLDNPDKRQDAKSLLIRRVIEAYAALVPHLSRTDLERAVQFCIECCEKRSGSVQRDAVIVLLPRLLRHSNGDERLANTYTKLLEIGKKKVVSRDEELLLIGVFSGLQNVANMADAPLAVSRIWELAFRVATAADEYGRLRSHIVTSWRVAATYRVPYARQDELHNLRIVIAEYMTAHPHAPEDTQTYFEIASVAAAVRKRIDADLPGGTAEDSPMSKEFRTPNRAVVPPNIDILLSIAPAGCTPVEARLVNFSVDDTGGVWTRGAWATSPSKPDWGNGRTRWRDAVVTVKLTPPVVFERAKVNGPIPEGEGGKSAGYRIKLGPAALADSMKSLKSRWELWAKR